MAVGRILKSWWLISCHLSEEAGRKKKGRGGKNRDEESAKGKEKAMSDIGNQSSHQYHTTLNKMRASIQPSSASSIKKIHILSKTLGHFEYGMALSDLLRLESIRKISRPSPIIITIPMHSKNTCPHLAKHKDQRRRKRKKKKKRRATLLPLPKSRSYLERGGA